MCLPLLESSTPAIRLYIAQLLAFGVRIPKHRTAVTDWLPPADRMKEHKGKRGWEVTALIDANSPGRQGGWVMRQLAGMLNSKDFVVSNKVTFDGRDSLNPAMSNIATGGRTVCYCCACER